MYIKADDLNMYYYDSGQPNKQVLVFIHDLGENLDSWQNQLDYFKNDYRIIVMDLRGHNRTNDGNKKLQLNNLLMM